MFLRGIAIRSKPNSEYAYNMCQKGLTDRKSGLKSVHDSMTANSLHAASALPFESWTLKAMKLL